jgi:uncharacterized protein (TIGR02265 family)
MNLRALDLVAAHCDIEERLRAIPPSARIRGLAFGPIKSALARAGKMQSYEDLFGKDPHGSMSLYPLGDYVLRVAVAAALVRSPQDVLRGMFEISRENARDYTTNSMLGRMLIRILANDPVRLSEQGLAMRRQTCLYGRWELVKHGPRDIEMIYYDEYLWIEHCTAGSAQGTFEACGVHPDITTQLRDRWHGSTRIRW